MDDNGRCEVLMEGSGYRAVSKDWSLKKKINGEDAAMIGSYSVLVE